MNLNSDWDEMRRARTEAEETLRLVAERAEPEGVARRVHRRLAAEMGTETRRRGFWGLWLPAHRLQFAGAAVLALAVGGSVWMVGRAPQAGPSPMAVQAPVVAPAAGTASGFKTSGAEGHPAGLTPIHVPAVGTKKKPSASKRKVRASAPAPVAP